MQSHLPAEPPPSANPYAAPASATSLHTSVINTRPCLRWQPLISLLVIALLAAMGWRAEIEIRSGWAGTGWMEYFHRAVPPGLLAFALWVLYVTRVQRTWAFATALVVFGVLGYMGMRRLVFFFFANGTSAIMAILDLGRGDFMLGEQRFKMLAFSAPFVWGLVPLIFSAICRCFGVPVKVLPVLASTVMFYLSWPLAIFVRSFFDHRGGADLIHALKSGYLIPFLIISLGLPVLHALRNTAPVNHMAHPHD